MKKEDKFFYEDLVEKLKENKFLNDQNFEVKQEYNNIIIKKTSAKVYYELEMWIDSIFGLKKKYRFVLSSNTFYNKRLASGKLINHPSDVFYFLDDDFDKKIFKSDYETGDEKSLNHFPNNLFNNLILLIKYTYKKKGLNKTEFQEIFELTNFGNPNDLG